MKILAISNQKGGVGKTTTAVNVGACLAEAGAAVLLVDCDPQANASLHLGIQSPSPGLYDAFRGRTDLAALVETTKWVDLVPPGDLDGVDVALANEPGREYLLRNLLRPLRDSYEYAILDCPPNLGVMTVAALAAADYVLIPASAQGLSLSAIRRLKRTAGLVKERLNERLQEAGVVITRARTQTIHARQVIERIRAEHAAFETAIPEVIALTEAATHGQPIIAYDPAGAGAVAYRTLTAEIARRCA